MKISARVLAASQIWQDVLHGGLIDQAMKSWSVQNRYAGSGDRRFISALLYAMARNRYSFGGKDDLAMALAVCAHEGLGQAQDIRHDGLHHHLQEVQQAYDTIGEIPIQVQKMEMPDWLAEQFIGGVEAIKGLKGRADIILREHPHNPLNNDQELNFHGFQKTNISPFGWVRPHEDKRFRLEELAAYRDGFLEVQDEASQMACVLLAPEKGQRILDYCAGGGGKSLLISSLSQQSQIFVHDHDKKRMRDIPKRFGQAGLAIPTPWNEADRSFDLVLADVPCTGSGTWRRQPERRWQCDEAELANLLETQANILRKAASLVREDGLLAYMTCSMLYLENTGQISAFLQGQDEFVPVPLAEWPGMCRAPKLPPQRGEGWLQWSPHLDGTDGFFVALLKKRDVT